MKFTEHLGAHITPEWRKQYINYEEMKQILYGAVEGAPSSELVEPEVLTRYYAKFDEKFYHYCDKELTKINTFFSEKLAEATRKSGNLKSEVSEALENEWVKKAGGKSHKAASTALLKKQNAPARKIAELKLAYSEYYLSLVLLQNYQELNSTGFRKILKKHDKLLAKSNGSKYFSENVTTTPFATNKDISRLLRETEETMTELEAGDRTRAMKRLRVPPMAEKQSPWITFKVGLFSGSFIVLLLAVILSAIAYLPSKGDWLVPVRLFRSQLLVVLFTFLMGVNVYGWRSSGVNHVLIFELDPRHHLSEQHIMEIAAIFAVMWTLSVLAFIYSDFLGIPAFVNPLALTIIMIVFLFNPTKTLRHEARFWTIRVMVRIISAPFFYVGFADFWLADQLTSLVPALVDQIFFTCYYITITDWNIAIDVTDICITKYHYLRLIMSCLPYWFRFAQCLRRYRDTKEKFPHLANAGKYATSFFVITFSHIFLITNIRGTGSFESITGNPWFYMWLFATIVSTAYSYTWDIKMDWGLFDKNASEHKFLREETVYSSCWYYYGAIAGDLMARLGWIMSISLVELGFVHAEIMVSILSTCEVFRRFIWNFFRLENEHLNNCGKFRAVRDISVAPIDSSDQGMIIKMMDATDDTVINRGKHKATKKSKKDEVRLVIEHDESTDADI